MFSLAYRNYLLVDDVKTQRLKIWSQVLSQTYFNTAVVL